MKTLQTYLYSATLFAIIILFASCSRKMVFGTSQIEPAATGSVKLKKDKNKNQSIEVNVANLAPAEKLTPPRSMYVVWMVTDDNRTRNIGQLKSSTGFLSKKLKASLNTVTPFSPVRFFITAENDGEIQYPGVPVVLSTN